eukprot:1031396-Pyramimonas_sp.AAC.1
MASARILSMMVGVTYTSGSGKTIRKQEVTKVPVSRKDRDWEVERGKNFKRHYKDREGMHTHRLAVLEVALLHVKGSFSGAVHDARDVPHHS